MPVYTEVARLDAPSGGIFSLTSLTLTGYRRLQMILAGVCAAGTDSVDPVLTFFVGGAEQTGASDHRWQNTHVNETPTSISDGDTGDPSMFLNSNDVGYDMGGATGEGFDAIFMIDEPLSTAHYKKIASYSVLTNASGLFIAGTGAAVLQNAGAIDGVKVAGATAFTAGHAILLGMT